MEFVFLNLFYFIYIYIYIYPRDEEEEIFLSYTNNPIILMETARIIYILIHTRVYVALN